MSDELRSWNQTIAARSSGMAFRTTSSLSVSADDSEAYRELTASEGDQSSRLVRRYGNTLNLSPSWYWKDDVVPEAQEYKGGNHSRRQLDGYRPSVPKLVADDQRSKGLVLVEKKTLIDLLKAGYAGSCGWSNCEQELQRGRGYVRASARLGPAR